LAALNLTAISFSEKGKIDVINMNVVLPLIRALQDLDDRVVEAATIALSSLAQRNEAKFEVFIYMLYVYKQIMDNDKLSDILHLLDHPNEEVKLNIVQLIASMAEHPKGRKDCHQCLDQLKAIMQYEYIAPYAKYAIEVILWKP
jgi:HEAT repeat protein